MGKSGKKQKHSKKNHRPSSSGNDDGGDTLPSSAYNLSPTPVDQLDSDGSAGASGDKSDDIGGSGEEEPSSPLTSKFDLYQRSVQSPRGDISYLQKFFLLYIGGRVPLHLQEDFCGTALLCSEWLRGDPRRTAVGIDLDQDALNWCLETNLTKIGADGYSRTFLFHVIRIIAQKLPSWLQDLIPLV